MLAKIYGVLWIMTAVAAGAIFVSGNFTIMVAVAFGFILFGMVFMGMISVLPSTVAHPSNHAAEKPNKQAAAPVFAPAAGKATASQALAARAMFSGSPRFR